MSALEVLVTFAKDYPDGDVGEEGDTRALGRAAAAELARFRELEQIAERMAAGITKERLRHTYERTTVAAAMDFMAWKESTAK